MLVNFLMNKLSNSSSKKSLAKRYPAVNLHVHTIEYTDTHTHTRIYFFTSSMIGNFCVSGPLLMKNYPKTPNQS